MRLILLCILLLSGSAFANDDSVQPLGTTALDEARTIARLPEWMKPFYGKGLVASLN